MSLYFLARARQSINIVKSRISECSVPYFFVLSFEIYERGDPENL